ncbi:MAG TPA: CRTAC1 family protein [Roseiflexaceae bacterium]|nr:CRTAC1 family protein [Roseiflexaceae bacterium]
MESPLHVLRSARRSWAGARLFALVLLLAGCAEAVPTLAPTPAAEIPVRVAKEPLAQPQPCTGAFVAHTLDYSTTSAGNIALYEANGAGLAIGDLDGDGRLDIVMANLDGPNAILWNEGDFQFRREDLPFGRSRAAAIVDVDADGKPDIVFTRRFEKPAYLHNTGKAGTKRFVVGTLPGVNNPFYSMTWGDLNGDGTLELIAGSYDTELLKQAGPIFQQQGGGVGVFVYRRQGDSFEAQRLANAADALAIALPDLDGDGRPDIVVGNDFNRPDYAWVQQNGAWRTVTPFAYTSENTMSLDVGDIDNDGRPEIFATDMKPADKDLATMARWLPMMKLMTRPLTSSDPQHVENTLQINDGNGHWSNQAYERFVDSSGWSWSGKFGDLDNDGFLDIYVVNGMIAAGLFDYLPNHELVEPNVVFRNDGRGSFTAAASWGLGSLASGRGMSMADLNGDGNLDIVVNNLQSPAQVFENRLCGGKGLEVDLFWPASKNVRAIGAQLALHASSGTYYRDVRAVSGYISGDAPRIHFGLPADAAVQRLEIRWPDGKVSNIGNLSAQTLIAVTR